MILDGIIGLDKSVTLALNSLHSGFMDRFWMFFSAKSVWIPLYALILAGLFWRLGWKRALVFTGAVLLTVLCCDRLSDLCKDFFARLRPCVDPEMVARGLRWLPLGPEPPRTGFGFFSGHASNAFGVAYSTFLAFRTDTRLKYRGYTAFIFAWAALVSISRIFVGAHFFGDILVGTAVGCFIGAIWGLAGRYCIRRFI